MANLQEKNSHTRREIEQQPALWVKTVKQLAEERDRIESFFQQISEKHERVRVIFTGAGTSAFIGETIYPYVRQFIRKKGWEVEAISTTNITATPYYYLDKDIPTIMVSFARSGNSPESIQTVKLGEQLLDHFYEVSITCNKDGALAKRERTPEEQLVIVLPEESNDKGLAMTSSYSTMVLTALYIFSDQKDEIEKLVEQVSKAGQAMLETCEELIPKLVEEDIAKLVYLGSGVYEGLSREAALKFLELTAGKYPTMFDTTLGFRHGPKSILDPKTMVVVYLSNHPYTRKYDMDMLKELYTTPERGPIVALTGIEDPEVGKYSDHHIVVKEELDDIWRAFAYIIFAQMFAYKKSLHSGISPDNPSPTGVINRVVQGVILYPYEEEK